MKKLGLQQENFNGSITADSLKIRIPLTEVEIIDKTLIMGFAELNKWTGETKDKKSKLYDKTTHGVPLLFDVRKINADNETFKDYLTATVNAKQLQEQYFEGLTIDNIKRAYDYITSFEVANFTFESFLKAECTDVDYKQDFEIEPKRFIKMIDMLYSIAKPFKKINEGCERFRHKDNLGIMFGIRNKANYGKPYIKYYYKSYELKKEKNKEFINNYLGNIDNINNLARVEFTIKDKKHFRYYGINETSLATILNLGQDKKREIMQDIHKKYLEKRVNANVKNRDGLTPMEIALIMVIKRSMDVEGLSFDMIEKIILPGMPGKTARSRMKKKLNELYELEILGTETDKENKELSKVYEKLGLTEFI